MEASELFVTGGGGPADEDAISINSTLASEQDSDEEWLVEGIRYQIHADGKDKYLVEWTGYRIEQATWEPEENVTRELLQEWRDTQKRQARGEEEPFDIAAWQESVDKDQAAKYERHRKRNVQRKRQGQQLKLWEGETTADYYLSDEDVGQDDFNAVLPPPKPVEWQADSALSDENEPKTSLKQVTVERPHSPRKRTPVAESVGSPTQKSTPVHIPQQPSQSFSAPSTANGQQGTAKQRAMNKPIKKTSVDRTPATTAPSRGIHKAKKTAVSSRTMARSQHSGSGINVFAAGKQIRQRRQLVHNVADPTKDPSMFASHRLRRKVELQSREKGDQAPAILPTKLFSISRGPPPGSNPSTSSAAPRSASKRSVDGFVTRSASESSATASEKTDSTLPPNLEQQQPTRPTVKKRKSVQFADFPLVDEPESMELDSPPASRPRRLLSPPVGPQPIQPAQPHPQPQQPQPILRKLSIAEYQSRSLGQSIEKHVILGPSQTKDVEMTFENVRNDSEVWHSDFVGQEALHFTRSFTARTFALQKGTVVERNLSNGSVRPKMADDQVAIDRAAERLRLGSFGVACFHDEFLVIIYPARCEDWKNVMTEIEATSPATVALKYVIFKPHPIATRPLPVRKVASPKSTDPRATVLQDLLRLDYHRLVPPGVRDTRHNFYLAFPPSRKTLLDALSEWLHVENPKCRVFSTKTAGDWSAFTDPKIVEQGVVIVHEAAADTLRRFPGLLKLLLHNKSAAYVFWCIGESLQKYPMYPSIRSMHHGTDPGILELTRFFPHGNAILVTPSFLVSEPRRALQLFEWYRRTYQKPNNNQKIVAAAGICEYLRELAFDRSNQRNDLLAEGDRTRRRPNPAREETACKAGLGREDCAARFETWAIVDDLRPSLSTNIMPDEQLEPIIFADGCIDANDEQSLVNWFGYWSQTRFDQFRKFHVLGTDDSSDNSHFIKVDDIPMYPPGAGRDPGAEAEVVTHTSDPAEKALDSPHQPQSNGSKRLMSLAAQSFISELMTMSKTFEGPRICPFGKVFGFPVSYFEDIADTADSFGDFHREFATFERWLNFSWPFFSIYQPNYGAPEEVGRGPTVFNTYFAFFYTSYGDSQSQQYGRHPWLAIWRVHAPHLKWKGTELLIWDIAAKERYPTGSQLYESHLVPAQQHLVQLVREKSKKKHRGLPLLQVWFGGFEPEPTKYTLPIDVTLTNLEAMVMDTKKHLPALENLLPVRGFQRVYPGAPPAAKESHTTNKMEVDPIGRHQNHGSDSKIIFHPPQAYKPTRPSKCENLFYKWAMSLNRKDPHRKAYPYSFPPTVEWYSEQQIAENRHFEHINVSSWQRVFELVRIPTDDMRKDRPEAREEGKQ
ncbi:hypothetical protein EsH8_II_001065 [Colletotrichum jinshuiense]